MSDFEALYRKYAGDVYRFALHLCGNRAQAEDLTSEAFVLMWTASDRLRLPTVKSYLFTIARNLYLESLRHSSRRVELEELPHPAPGPYDQAESSERLATVLRGLRLLTEADRAALLMRAEEGMSYEEIAAALNLSVAATRVRIHRARVRLAQYCISKEEE